MSWVLKYTAQAKKDAKKVTPIAKKKLLALLSVIENAPFATPPRYEVLVGRLKGAYSRRISFQHRLVYQVLEEERVVKVLRVWTHYE